MASIFPPSPAVGDYFTSNNTTWQWNGEAWVVLPAEGTTFKNIVTNPSTETVVADSGADTLNLIAGENISISANSSTDSITINSTGSYTSVDSIVYPDYIVFDTTPENTSASTSTLSWDEGEGGLGLQLNPNIQVTLGQEVIVKCYNGEITTLNKGEVVMVSGAQGEKPRIIRAYNTSDAGSARTFGIVAESIPSGEEGFVVTQGVIKNVNTNAFNSGDPLYLSATPGQLTTTKPQAPNHYVWVGVVLKKNSSSGRIYVKPQNGYELDEIHDVRITSASAGDTIVYNSASSIWVNTPLTTTNVVEGSNLYFTNQRAIDAIGGTLGNASAQILQDANDNIPTLFVHDNHTNITATYNSASNQIVLNTSGGLPAYGFDYPLGEGNEGQVYYQINSASTQVINYFQYIGDEWINLGSDFNSWDYLLDGNWQYVLDEATGGWIAVWDGGGFATTASVDFNYRYIPHLVGEILFLSKNSASSTYLPISTASTLYVSKNGDTVNGELDVLGNFTASGSVVYLNSEHVHISNNFITLNTGAASATLNAGIEVNRGSQSPVTLRWNETENYWEFTNDGSTYNELGSGGGTVLYQVDQPDVSELEPGALWVDSDQDAVSGLVPATFSRWVKTLSASTSTISGVDDNSETLLYNVDNEQVFINGTLLVRDNDYVGTSGSAIVLTEPSSVGDVVEIHSYQQIVLVDTYTTGEVDSLLDNIDALPPQTGNTGKYLTTNGSSASWGVLVIPETSSAAFTRWTKVYAASATLISVADDNAINLEYDLGLEQLFINGVMIARNEYTATSGSTIVLNDALSVNDVVDIYSYQNTNNISTYSQAQIDAKYNNLVRWKKAYSASATVISGLDDNSVSLSYTSNYEQVYLNGILLTPITDYARTSASVITLGQAVISGDIIEVIGYAPFNVAEEVLPYSTSTPASPIAGSVWVDSTNPASPLLKVYNGSTWVSVSGGDSGLHPFFTAGI